MKKFFGLIFLIFGLSGNLVAQKILPLDTLIGQKASQWCWAASMEMVARYYGFVDTVQCLIVDRHMDLRNRSSGVPADCVSACDTTPVQQLALSPGGGLGFLAANSVFGVPPATGPVFNATNQSIYNLPLDFNFSGDPSTDAGTFHASEFDIVLSHLGFYSIEDYLLLTWDQYKDEIDSCRPVILMYDASGENYGEIEIDDGGDTVRAPEHHAVVAIGYENHAGEDYFVINDPWKICEGNRFRLNRQVLQGEAYSCDSAFVVSKILSMVHHIQPKEPILSVSPCPEPALSSFRTAPAPNDDFLEAVDEFGDQFIGTSLGSGFTQNDIEEFNPENHYTTPVYYFSYKKFANAKSISNMTFEDLTLDRTVLERNLMTGESEEVSALISCVDNCCLVETMTVLKDVEPLSSQIPGGERILLSNRGADREENPEGLDVVNYSVVEFHPHTFRLYRFEYEGTTYYLPTEEQGQNYFYGLGNRNSAVAITEPEVLDGLHEYTQDFPWGRPPKENKLKRFRKRLDNDGFICLEKYLRRARKGKIYKSY